MRRTKICRRLGVFTGALILAGAVFSCSPVVEDTVHLPPANLELSSVVHTPNYTAGTNGTVNLTGLQNNDVFLVLANATGQTVSYGGDARGVIDMENRTLDGTPVPPAGIRDSIANTADHASRVFTAEDGTQITAQHFKDALVFPASGTRFAADSQAARAVTSYTNAALNTERAFYVDASNKKKTATLRSIGSHCKVWVANDTWGADANQVAESDITALAQKFDDLYPLETNLLGYEAGGGPGGNGGADGDSKIQILIYDIYNDYKPNQNIGVAGYFYSGDELQSGGSICSNEAEIIYLDAYYTKTYPSLIHSTLVHEFNHMINYNVKTITNGKNYATWYTEMLSMLAEDVIAPLINIPVSSDGHPVPSRIPLWLASYWQYPPFNWDSSSAERSLYYYASNFAFGAYLMRNFGGAVLLSNIAKSALTDKNALDTSLRALNGENRGLTFALRRFGEALVYTTASRPSNIFSFNNTVTRTVSGVSYTFTGFDINNMIPAGRQNKGPPVFLADKAAEAPDNTIRVMGKQEWLKRSGSLTITLTNPGGADLFVMVR